MSYQRTTIIETLVAGGRCSLARGGTPSTPEPFADSVAALEAAIGLAVRAGELPPETDARSLAVLCAATVAGLELARWELGPGTDVLLPYDIFARGLLSAAARRRLQPEVAARA
jgi:hypothetical protein